LERVRLHKERENLASRLHRERAAEKQHLQQEKERLHDELDREIQRAKHCCAARSMINEGIVRGLLDEREAELQTIFRALVDDLQEQLDLRKCELASIIVEKEPEAKMVVEKILREHKEEMTQMHGKLDHTYAVIEQDRKATHDAKEATARMRKETQVLRDRLAQLRKKSREQAELLKDREAAVGMASFDECIHEVKRMTTYLDCVGHDAADLALQGFFVGNEQVRPSQQIEQREEITGLAPALPNEDSRLGSA